MPIVRAVLPILLALLVACGEQRPPAPDSKQSDQLDEAERLLDAAANEEGPADRSAGPSADSRSNGVD